jgi:hypothetical protein
MKYQIGEKLAFTSSTSEKKEEIEVVLTKTEIQKNDQNAGGNPDYLVKSLINGDQYFCVEKELDYLPDFF